MLQLKNSATKMFQKICFCFAVIILFAANANAGRWLTRDPIGFMELDPKPATVTQQANLYTFVDNNPINAIDPLGLYVQYTTTGGMTYVIGNNTSDLIQALQNVVSSGNQITDLRISGHGTPDLITLDANQTQLLTAPGNNILLTDGSDDNNLSSTDITSLLQKALAPGAKVELNACHTASGNNNLAQNMSQILPNTTVSGISTYAFGPAGGGLGTGTEGLWYGIVLGLHVNYVNGNKQ